MLLMQIPTLEIKLELLINKQKDVPWLSLAVFFQDTPDGIPTGVWHCTTAPCSNMPLCVGSRLSTVAKSILTFSVTEHQDVGFLNPVLINFLTKKASGRRYCSYSSGRR